MMCKRISFSSQAYSRFWPNSKDTLLWTPCTVYGRISGITERIEKPRTPLKRAEKSDSDSPYGFSFPVQNTKIQT